jgi:hypothetical protein
MSNIPTNLMFSKAERGFVVRTDHRGTGCYPTEWAFTSIEEVAAFFLAAFGNQSPPK